MLATWTRRFAATRGSGGTLAAQLQRLVATELRTFGSMVRSGSARASTLPERHPSRAYQPRTTSPTLNLMGVWTPVLMELFSTTSILHADVFKKLRKASSTGNCGLLKELIEKQGVDVNHASELDGDTALHRAVCGGQEEAVHELLGCGANLHALNSLSDAPIHDACRFEQLGCLRMLLEKGAAVNVMGFRGNTPLHWAAITGNMEATKLLLEAGADCNICDEDGFTPLHEGANSGSVDVVQMLIDSGAEIDAVCRSGDTALAYACKVGNYKVAKCLIEAGADKNTVNNDGDSPRDLVPYTRRYRFRNIQW